MRRRPKTQLQKLVTHSPFDAAVASALVKISPVEATQLEYRRDVDEWLVFCRERRLNPFHPIPSGIDPETSNGEESVAAWVQWMKRHGRSPNTRARKISALSSVYRELRRKKIVRANPFSSDEGPKREKVTTITPTPIAPTEDVLAALKRCDQDHSPLGVRDESIIRLFWSTGVRRVSLLSMTWEWLQHERGEIIATVLLKGGKTHPILIRGRTYKAFTKWLEVLKRGGFTTGPIWLDRQGLKLNEKAINRMLDKRSKDTLSPHMLRVAFLTRNPASLAAKQHAAGHADPGTTMLYDRNAWLGREAFEQMPEPEDL